MACLIQDVKKDSIVTNEDAVLIEIENRKKIEIENCFRYKGVEWEDCSEGTKNAGWIDPGDWLEYNIELSKNGYYSICFRCASEKDTGEFDVLVGDKQLAHFTGREFNLNYFELNLKE